MNTSASASPVDAPVERLPFRVEIASSDDLIDVARLRVAAYGKHLPGLAAKLLQPEAADLELGNEVFVARSRLDGSLLGSFRTHANIFKPLPLEASMELPQRFRGTLMIEATRLCVLGGPEASLVRNALFKAYFNYCLMQKVDWMLAAGRRPVDRLYDAMLWSDVEEPGKLYPMAHAANVPHRVMCLQPLQAEPVWRAAQHPLFEFAFQTIHPDIDFTGMVNLEQIISGLNVSRLARVPDHSGQVARGARSTGDSVQQLVHAHVGGLDKERRAGVGLGL